MTLRSSIGKIRRKYLCRTHSRPVDLGGSGPFVSFCFDDFPRSAYTTGGAILKNYGVRGTYYAAPGLMNKNNALGDQLQREDIDSLLAEGHELGCHTFSHLSSRSVSASKYLSDVERGRDAIREMTGIEALNFAYPYGHVNADLKKIIGLQMRSCRSIYGGINAPAADLNLLLANRLYGDVDQLSAAKVLLDENRKRNGWLIFYTHDVSQRPSPYGCTPALLEECVYLAAKSGFKIARIEDVLNTLQNVSSKERSSGQYASRN
jgi:peptidoglycan/xylan/chitin deacetylase (PgdA/CDA1 family)